MFSSRRSACLPVGAQLRVRVPSRLGPMFVDARADDALAIDIGMQAIERKLRRQDAIRADKGLCHIDMRLTADILIDRLEAPLPVLRRRLAEHVLDVRGPYA